MSFALRGRAVWAWVGFLALVVVVWLLVWRFDPDLRRGRQYDAELKVRAPLSDEAMISQYFAGDDIAPDVPVQIRRVFAKHMQYPAEKLLPDDDFAFFWAELDMAELIEELEADFGINITAADAERTPCKIRAVSQLVASKAGRTKSCT